MGKIVIAIIMAVVGLAAIGGVVIVNNRSSSNTSNLTQATGNEVSSTQNNANISTNSSSTVEPLSGEVSVSIADFAYKPATVTIKKGTKVTWTNQDSTKHDVTPDDGDSDAFRGSELLAKGQSYSFTFNNAGKYTYNCSPHPYMKGTVNVVE